MNFIRRAFSFLMNSTSICISHENIIPREALHKENAGVLNNKVLRQIYYQESTKSLTDIVTAMRKDVLSDSQLGESENYLSEGLQTETLSDKHLKN